MVQSALGKRLAIILLALIPAMAFAQPLPTPTDAMPRVHIETGVLAGVVRGPAVVFRGVPYAAPPVGSRRWFRLSRFHATRTGGFRGSSIPSQFRPSISSIPLDAS